MHRGLWNEQTEAVSYFDGSRRYSAGFFGTGDSAPDCHSVTQVHGTAVVEAGPETVAGVKDRIRADGLFTSRRGITLGVKTADCLPVVLVASDLPWISVLHAGWRGLFGGIIHEAAKIFKGLGGQPGGLCFFAGPCISQEFFEVGPELLDSLNTTCLSDPEKQQCIRKGRKDRWHIDLSSVAAFQALHEGVKPGQIKILRSCTYANPDLWNSYRRTGKASPSNWTCASLSETFL